jgi:serpin B
MKTKTLFMALAILTIAFSCEETPSENNEHTDNKEITLKSEEIVSVNNEFVFEFFRQIHNNETLDNYMVSPVSLSLALGMAYNGSAGETAKAFENTLGYRGFSFEEINLTNKALIENLAVNKEGNLFEIANSIWSRLGFPIKPSFLELNNQYYKAEAQELNFDLPSALDTINGWVKTKPMEKSQIFSRKFLLKQCYT